MDSLLIGKKLFDRTVALLQRSLDIRSSRHRILSNNVANVETPGYASQDLPFEKILERFMDPPSVLPLRKTHPLHLPPSGTEYSPQDFTSEVETDPGAEGVNIDEQMAKLAENNLMFQAGIQALIKKFETLKHTISETR